VVGVVTTTLLVDALERALPGQVERDASSATLTTYRCGGPLAALVRAEREQDLERVAEVVHGRDVPLLVIGRGSNLLVADTGFDGVAVVLGGDFEHLDLDRPTWRAHAGAAVALPVLARRAAAAGFGGLEFFVGIPGSVGGAVRMNAGGHGRETKDVIVEARVWRLDEGRAEVLAPADLELGYRRSALTATSAVVHATFAAHEERPDVTAARIDEVVRWRREHQPGGQNAGSVFTNPPGDAAGRLVEACGAKGLRIGGAVVSEKHANFFVADPGATAADVHALVREVQRRVEASSGIRLEPELHLVGFRSEHDG
jgi:UDP-N-acetylmuramate dehydrogenase